MTQLSCKSVVTSFAAQALKLRDTIISFLKMLHCYSFSYSRVATLKIASGISVYMEARGGAVV